RVLERSPSQLFQQPGSRQDSRPTTADRVFQRGHTRWLTSKGPFVESPKSATSTVSLNEMPIDYSKWDKLEVSDDEEDRPRSPAAQAAPPDFSEMDFDEEGMKAIEAEHEQLQDFVGEHDCPAKEVVVEWLKDAAGPGKLDSSEQNLKSVLEDLGLMEAAVTCFDYDCLRRLWRAPLAGRKEAERIQREVGMELDRKGGMACMRLHYYMLNYAMCGQYFFGAIPRSTPVMCYVNHLNIVWSGIGEWLY
ncbi:unnamed protein product, partial [Symbiodinium sp. CCMP2456]